MKGISVVVPIYNEEGNVAELHKQINTACMSTKLPYEIIFIDDGSTDKTKEIALGLKPLKYIEFRRNFGQTAAMDAGIHHAQYDYIVTMDGDLQNDPAEIPNLIRYLEEHDLDVVSGWRKNRKDTFMKRFASRGANFLRKLIVHDGIHDSGCSLKIYRKECFDHVHLYGEMHRFIPAVLRIQGFKIGEMVVNQRPRTSGVTKYNWKRTFKGFVDMISLWFWSKYASRPLHLFGTVGIISLFLGGICAIMSIIKFIMYHSVVNSTWPLLTVFFLIAGIQFFIFGLLADIMSKMYRQTTDDKSYNIKQIIENK